jgi:hypothetical protein
MPAPPEGEGQLRQLAQRFADAEARIRDLVREAVKGNKRDLLAEALAILIALRQLDIRRPVTSAYVVAFVAVGNGGELRTPTDLARSLHLKLDQAAATASERSRVAFRRATVDNLEEMSLEAVTADVDRQGKRWPLGAYAEMQALTIGRHASSRGTLDAVGPTGFVKVSDHNTKSEVCKPLEGKTYKATEAPQPPFHPHCKHYLIPA